MTLPLQHTYDGFSVILHQAMLQMIPCLIGMEHHITGPSFSGWRVAYTPEIDHMPRPNAPIQGPMRVANTNEVRFTPLQAALDRFVTHGR
jgi:hypothetical protein